MRKLKVSHSWCIVDAFWPQLMRFDHVSNPPFCLQVHILTCHSVLGAHLCSQEMFILVLSKQSATDVRWHINTRRGQEIESTVQNKGHAWILVVGYMWVDRESGLQVNRPISGLDAWVVMVEYRKKMGEIISWVWDILSLRCRLPLQWRYSARGS